MAIKNKAQLKADVNNTIKANGVGSITGPKDNVLRIDLIDSIPTFKDGGSFEVEVGYVSGLTPSNDYSFATKKYVDDNGGGISLTDLSATNGINYDNTTGVFKLGGPLIENTDINGAYALRFGLITPLTAFDVETSNAILIDAGTTLTLSSASQLTLSSNTKVSIQAIGATPIELSTNGAIRQTIDASGNTTFSGNVQIGTGGIFKMFQNGAYQDIIRIDDVNNTTFVGRQGFRFIVNSYSTSSQAVAILNNGVFKSWVGSQLQGQTQVDNIYLYTGTYKEFIGFGAGSSRIGAGLTTENILIQTNSGVTRQTTDIDGLVTFNGTSGNAGVVRMRQLSILDNDGVTWRDVITGATGFAGQLAIGRGVVQTILNNGIQINLTGTQLQFIGASATIQGGINGLTVNGNLGTLNLLTSSGTGVTAPINITSGTTSSSTINQSTGEIFISSGSLTSVSTVASQSTRSVRIDSGSVAGGSATRGGVVFFNGNAEPTWNGLQRGIFVGNATAVPTGNPTNGYYMYSNSGVPTFRTSAGNVISLSTQHTKEVKYFASGDISQNTVLEGNYVEFLYKTYTLKKITIVFGEQSMNTNKTIPFLIGLLDSDSVAPSITNAYTANCNAVIGAIQNKVYTFDVNITLTANKLLVVSTGSFTASTQILKNCLVTLILEEI